MLENDPRDLLLDEDNDLIIVDGDLAFSKGIPGVVQEGRIAMQLFGGEWFLDLDRGIPYWDSILGQKLEVATYAAKLSMTAAIRDIEDVTDIPLFTIDYEPGTRAMRVKWRSRTSFGDTPVDTLVLATTGTA